MKQSKTKQYPALFATNTVDGPQSSAHLVALLQACGMSAAAWIVQDMADKISDAETAAEDAYQESLTAIEDAKAEVQNEMNPYKVAFEAIADAIGWSANTMPEDESIVTSIREDVEFAAVVRAERALAEKQREEVRAGSAERRKRRVPA